MTSGLLQAALPYQTASPQWQLSGRGVSVSNLPGADIKSILKGVLLSPFPLFFYFKQSQERIFSGILIYKLIATTKISSQTVFLIRVHFSGQEQRWIYWAVPPLSGAVLIKKPADSSPCNGCPYLLCSLISSLFDVTEWSISFSCCSGIWNQY